MSAVSLPDWVPQLEENSKILIIGASGGIGQAVVRLLLRGPTCVIGAHRSTADSFSQKPDTGYVLIDLPFKLQNDKDCRSLVDSFVQQAKGIDSLVVLCGGLSRNVHWKELKEEEWKRDMDLALNFPFFLSRAAMENMGEKGGQIILMGTESSLHGGNPYAFSHGVSKRGIECLVQGLAREGAGNNILVNGVRPGFIESGFHQRWQGKTKDDLVKRANMTPLKRAGKPEEVAALIIYLLSGWSRYTTGQMFPITGGDWL